MALTLNAEQKSIYDIFSGENQYIIPPYQRAYSWTQTHCKALFEDIRKAFYSEEQEGYFLGNIVLAKSREERNKLEVIDGQQRLTTLILLIKVLLSFDKENKALYNAIWIKDRRTDEEIQRLETNVFMEKDVNYFKEVLAFDFSKDIYSHIDDDFFRKNISYFYKRLFRFSQHNDIFKFSDFLLDKIYILPIETEDNNADKAREKALQIFETINNRGLNLSTSDIFKARLYSMALNELKHEDFIKKWKKLQNKCNDLNYKIDDIFKIYRYIVKAEKKMINQNIELKKFFLEEKDSPFFNKKYYEIIDDLLRISSAIELYKDVSIYPIKYGEITKWFQVIESFKYQKIDIVLIIYLYKNNFNLNSDLTSFCLNFIRFSYITELEYQHELDYYLINYLDESNPDNYAELIIDIMNNKKLIYHPKLKTDYTINITNVTALLGFYLNPNQSAIYPVNEVFKTNNRLYKDRIKKFIEEYA